MTKGSEEELACIPKGTNLDLRSLTAATKCSAGIGRHPETCLPPCHMVQAEEDTQEPANLMACPQQEPLQCASMWWIGGRGRGSGQFKHWEERLGKARLQRKSLGEVPTHAASEGHAWRASVTMHWQGSVSISMAHITTKDHENIPCQGSRLGASRCQRVMQSWPHPSLAVALGRAGSVPQWGNTMELC